MQKKRMSWKTRGMNQDLSVSAFNPEFSFENMNLRLSTKEGNTLMSWVNEKGTKEVSIDVDLYPWRSQVSPVINHIIRGIPVGYAVIKHQLVLFTTIVDSQGDYKDYIYLLTYEVTDGGGKLSGKVLYHGNINLDAKYPLETLVCYESDKIQKVYWVDGKNPSRFINIKASDKTLNTWNETQATGTQGHWFDFVPAVDLKEEVSIKRQSSGGYFSPGTIQYLITYSNKNGQESHVVYQSPLLYLSHDDRGASAEEMVTCTFTIKIEGADTSFDYIKLYSVQTTSLNSYVVKYIAKLAVNNTIMQYTDTGTTGSTVDVNLLRYIGGSDIIASSIVDKDNTLFLGNIEQKEDNTTIIQDYFDKERKEGHFVDFNQYKVLLPEQVRSRGIYTHINILTEDSWKFTTYKGGQTYRFGLQLQKYTGEWTEPIFIGDYKNSYYPYTLTGVRGYNEGIKLVRPYYHINLTNFSNYIQEFTGEGFDFSLYKKIRPLVVFPEISDYDVLCQGVLNPTVFNLKDREDNIPYAQSSWFFRPTNYKQSISTEDLSKGIAPEFEHFKYMGETADANAGSHRRQEVEYLRFGDMPSVTSDGDNPKATFFVDRNIVTMASPDITFNPVIQGIGALSKDEYSLRLIGIVPITSNSSRYHIDLSTGAAYNGKDMGWYIDTANTNAEATRRLVTNFLWSDSYVYRKKDGDTVIDEYAVYDGSDKDVPVKHFRLYAVYPWQRLGSLINDDRGTGGYSCLKTKIEGTLLYSCNTKYYNDASKGVSLYDVKICQESDNTRLFQLNWNAQQSIMYQANVDTVIPLPLRGCYIYNVWQELNPEATLFWDSEGYPEAYYERSEIIPMRYKSGSHIVMVLNAAEFGNRQPSNTRCVLPLDYTGHSEGDEKTYTRTCWRNGSEKYNTPKGNNSFGDTSFNTNGGVADDTRRLQDDGYGFLWLGELYKNKKIENQFGGDSKEALMNNNWIIAGASVNLDSNNPNITLFWDYGDTYFQRYDHVQTSPFSSEDTNQLVEIMSFMCETRMNIDGRYDANRELTDYTIVRPKQNYNLLNDAYTQPNNYIVYKKIDEDSKNLKHSNWICWSQSKSAGEEVDTYTQINIASAFNLDGNKGSINALKRFNDQIIAFQDSGVSRILFNDRTALTTTEGSPIEIGNTNKVQGMQYLSDSIGCSNKWSITSTPAGLYFMDSNNKNIYLYNGQFNNLSGKLGFDSWAKRNIPSSSPDNIWNPNTFRNFVSYYDALNQDVLFINNETALAYSEKLGTFTSFYSYGGAPYFCNLDDVGLWLTPGGSICNVWQHQAGDYCRFFNDEEDKPYWMTLVGNPEPQVDKIFTNLEFRATLEGEGTVKNVNENQTFTPYMPFDSLEVWDEYQHGYLTNASLLRKFRIWRWDIPRDNLPATANQPSEETTEYTKDTELGIKRYSNKPLDRMRNPWVYLKLKKNTGTSHKAEVHDLSMDYFV